MRFFTDQDVYLYTITKLRSWGYDVLTARDIGMDRATDEELLEKSINLERILITRDKDFGTLVFLHEKLTNGVILLRMTPPLMQDVHKELANVLNKYSFQDLISCFCVIESGRHRIRHLD